MECKANTTSKFRKHRYVFILVVFPLKSRLANLVGNMKTFSLLVAELNNVGVDGIPSDIRL